MSRLIEFFVHQKIFVHIVTFFVFLAGVLAVWSMNREAMPHVSFDSLSIQVIYPSASPDLVEKLIANPLENRLQNLDGVDELTSTSSEGNCSFYLRVNTRATSVDDIKDEVDDVLQSFQFPPGVTDYSVRKNESKIQTLLSFALLGEQDQTLRSWVTSLQRDLEKVPGIAQVTISGLPELEVRLEVDVEKQRALQVSFTDIVDVVKAGMQQSPAGRFYDSQDQTEKTVRSLAQVEDLHDFEQLVLRNNFSGQVVRLGDFTRVGLQKEKQHIFERVQGHESVHFKVSKRSSYDTIRTVAQVRDVLRDFQETSGLKLIELEDRSKRVETRVSVLSNNLLLGLLLVVVILSVMLPWRAACVAALGIPFAFCATMLVFQAAGMSLNLISMMGLIIVVGMLVDDAIVVTESVQRSMEEGLSAVNAAVQGALRVWKPVTTSVLTTMAAFLPLMDLQGIFGKFIRHIPIGVMVALGFSLLECLFLLPSHIASWGDKIGESKAFGASWILTLQQHYSTALAKLLRLRYLLFVGSLLWIGGSIWFAWQNLPFQFFPGTEKSEFAMYVQVEKPFPRSQYFQWAQQLEELAKEHAQKDLKWVRTTYDADQASLRFEVALTEGSDVKAVMTHVRESASFPEGAALQVSRRHSGPPVGKGLSFEILGQDVVAMNRAAEEMVAQLSKMPGAQDAAIEEQLGRGQLLMKLKTDQQKVIQVSSREALLTLQAHLDGVAADSLAYQGEEYDVRIGLSLDELSARQFQDIPVMTSDRSLVEFKHFADFIPQKSVDSYQHSNGMRVLKIEAEYDAEALSQSEQQTYVQSMLQNLKISHPGLQFVSGSSEKDRRASLLSLRTSLLLTVVGIFLLLVLQFQNMVQPFLVVYLIPMSVVSVLWAFYTHGQPLSFLGGVGMIALAGVVVNNGIVLLDAFNQNLYEGLERPEALLKAASTRLRPILMTTLTTAAGILPTAYGLGGYDAFVVPIALALGWGVVMGAVVTLLVFPPLLLIVEDMRKLRH